MEAALQHCFVHVECMRLTDPVHLGRHGHVPVCVCVRVCVCVVECDVMNFGMFGQLTAAVLDLSSLIC